MKEIWRDVEGYEGAYMVSNLGRVKSLTRRVPHIRCKLKTVKGTIKAPIIDKDGYHKVALSLGGKNKYFFIHRLVLLHFKGAGRGVVDHIDQNKTNNHITNLRWASLSLNQRNSRQSQRAVSQYNGVYFDGRPNRHRWYAQSGLKGQDSHIGCFSSEIYAAFAFDRYCIKHNLDRELNFL